MADGAVSTLPLNYAAREFRKEHPAPAGGQRPLRLATVVMEADPPVMPVGKPALQRRQDWPYVPFVLDARNFQAILLVDQINGTVIAEPGVIMSVSTN